MAKLATNENPFGASPHAIAAVADIGALLATYPDGNCGGLKRSLGEFLNMPAARIIIGNGSENLIELACLAYLSPDDRVVTQRPCFGLHDIFARMMSARVDKVPFDARFEFDVDAWRRALSCAAKAVMITNPSNPVGCCMDPDQFRAVIDGAPQDALLLIDEAYYEFAHGEGYAESLVELSQQNRPWLVLRTFSKAYGLAGLRIGYGIASSERIIDALDRVRTPFNVNAVAQLAATAALADQEHVRRSVAAIRAERQFLRGKLVRAGYLVAPSHANFLFFDCGEQAASLAERLLGQGVIVKPWQEEGYECFIRVTVGSRADSEQFLAALGAFSDR